MAFPSVFCPAFRSEISLSGRQTVFAFACVAVQSDFGSERAPGFYGSKEVAFSFRNKAKGGKIHMAQKMGLFS